MDGAPLERTDVVDKKMKGAIYWTKYKEKITNNRISRAGESREKFGGIAGISDHREQLFAREKNWNGLFRKGKQANRGRTRGWGGPQRLGGRYKT